MKIIKPPHIKIGDTIVFIAPSEPVVDQGSLNISKKRLQSLGYNVIYGKNIFRKHGGYMAGTDEERAADLNWAFANKKIKAIICATGGTIANRLLPLLDYQTIKNNPKIFMGYSDISTLALAIFAKTGLVTFHGPNAEVSLGLMNQYTQNSLLKAITETGAIGKLKPYSEWRALKEGVAQGRLIGGNLATLNNLLGTSFAPNFKISPLFSRQKTIFFWEEVGEEPDDIDQILMHYKLIGIFDKISAMIVGKLYNCKNVTYKKSLSIKEIILELTKNYFFPVLYNVDFGHTKTNLTLPIGIKARVTTKPVEIEILEAAVI